MTRSDDRSAMGPVAISGMGTYILSINISNLSLTAHSLSTTRRGAKHQ